VGIQAYPGKEKPSTSAKYQPQKSTKVTKKYFAILMTFLRFLRLFAAINS